MLGEASPPDQEGQLDALCEVANVICGNMLPELAGTTAVFHICPAEIVAPEQARSCSSQMPIGEAHLGLEGGRVELRLFMDDLDALSGLAND
jgi:hypothetical protein